MRYMNFRRLWLSAFLAIVVVTGCVTSRPDERKVTPQEQKTMSAIKTSFVLLAEGMSTGDLDKVFKAVSVQEWDRQPFKEFQDSYGKNKLVWQAMFRGSFLKTIGIENNMASAVVIWGTGESALLEFIKEGEGWKLLSMSLPAPVIFPGGAPPAPTGQ
ncbi:MAG: hypothetical protein V1701_10815 [Planctomycetota bacterium]